MKSEAATTYRPSNFVERIALALHAWKETFKATDGLGKAGMAINLPLPGLGSALLGRPPLDRQGLRTGQAPASIFSRTL